MQSLSRLVVGLGKCVHITPVLRDVLHQNHSTLNCVRGTGPAYFSSRVTDNSGCPGLCSAMHSDLFVPRNRTRLGRQELLHRSSSCLELTATSPSLPVHQSQSVSSRAQDSSFQAAVFHLPLLWELLKRLNWTELLSGRSVVHCDKHFSCGIKRTLCCMISSKLQIRIKIVTALSIWHVAK